MAKQPLQRAESIVWLTHNKGDRATNAKGKEKVYVYVSFAFAGFLLCITDELNEKKNHLIYILKLLVAWHPAGDSNQKQTKKK